MSMNILGIALITSTLVGLTDTLPPSIAIHVDSEDPHIVNETIQAIEERLLYAGYTATIHSDSSANTFLLQCNWDSSSKTDSTQLYNQLAHNELQIELALRQDDKIIRSLYQDMNAVDGIIIPEDYDPMAIFVSRDPELLDEQKAALIEMITSLGESKYESLRFVWTSSVKKVKQLEIKSYPAHILHAYNIDQTYDLTEADIKTASVKRRPYGDDVILEFKESSKNTWEDITLDAANDDARSVAIILNNEVLYTHPIRLVSDPCIISEISNRQKANQIADKIRIGRLPADVIVR